ncbi:hypothetical protein WMY93_032616 [Mugilogobius chulae]|uniref:Uncharacterized protein n=1 Tax=Mugilogobius chulae TaxID=88201 RepID=A0AAW0MJ91_9GOBI
MRAVKTCSPSALSCGPLFTELHAALDLLELQPPLLHHVLSVSLSVEQRGLLREHASSRDTNLCSDALEQNTSCRRSSHQCHRRAPGALVFGTQSVLQVLHRLHQLVSFQPRDCEMTLEVGLTNEDRQTRQDFRALSLGSEHTSHWTSIDLRFFVSSFLCDTSSRSSVLTLSSGLVE